MQKTLITGCLLLLSACRFGNYSEAPKPVYTSNFKNVELFSTEVKQLEVFVLWDDNTIVKNSNAPLVAVPPSLLSVFSDPVYWLTPTDPNSPQLFADYTLTNSKATVVDAKGHIDPNVVYSHASGQFWNNRNCQTDIWASQEGDFDRSNPVTSYSSDGTKTTIAGHLKLAYDYTQTWTGDCSDDLQELANCYQDGTGCTSEQLKAARSTFDQYVKQTGFLDITKASHVRGLEYTVHFE